MSVRNYDKHVTHQESISFLLGMGTSCGAEHVWNRGTVQNPAKPSRERSLDLVLGSHVKNNLSPLVPKPLARLTFATICRMWTYYVNVQSIRKFFQVWRLSIQFQMSHDFFARLLEILKSNYWRTSNRRLWEPINQLFYCKLRFLLTMWYLYPISININDFYIWGQSTITKPRKGPKSSAHNNQNRHGLPP